MKVVATEPVNELVLLGAEMAHVQLLAHLRQHPLPGVRVTLITPKLRLVYPAMLAGFVAGRHPLDACTIALETLVQPLVEHGSARWLVARAAEIDATASALLLDDGQVVKFDCLSINTEPLHDLDALDRALPGAREHGLFVHPVDTFCALWPRVPVLAAARALRVAVIGGLAEKTPDVATALATGAADVKGVKGVEGVEGVAESVIQSVTNSVATTTREFAANGPVAQRPAQTNLQAIELALAIRHRLPDSAVTLITGGEPLGHGEPPRLQKCLADALRQRNVTVLADSATQIKSGETLLGSGARLACDVPVFATRCIPRPPPWLAQSGLAVDHRGLIAVDANGQSTSHPNVFVTGQRAEGSPLAPDRIARAEAQRLAAHLAARLATPLTDGSATGLANDLPTGLAGGVARRPARAHQPAKTLPTGPTGPTRHTATQGQNGIRLISCGDGQAVAAWGSYAAQGRWAGWLKQWLDRAALAPYRK